MSDFSRISYPVAAKEHRCEWCFGTIEKKEKHVHFTGIWQGEFQNWRMHPECHDAADEYLADGFEPGSGERPKVEAGKDL